MSNTLYTRLLARCDKLYDHVPLDGGMADTLREVVELHAPAPCPWPCSLRHKHITCGACRWRGDPLSLASRWPCSTIQAIAEKLGVPVDDQERIEKEEVDG